MERVSNYAILFLLIGILSLPYNHIRKKEKKNEINE